jgi:hypothetical protein
MREKLKDLGLEYKTALHGIQTAIAYEMGKAELYGERHMMTESKHLRVGVDSSFITHAGVALLLLEKGIFTLEEYEEAIRLHANNELARYESMYAGMTFR